jgi:hypothetical protein
MSGRTPQLNLFLIIWWGIKKSVLFLPFHSCAWFLQSIAVLWVMLIDFLSCQRVPPILPKMLTIYCILALESGHRLFLSIRLLYCLIDGIWWRRGLKVSIKWDVISGNSLKFSSIFLVSHLIDYLLPLVFSSENWEVIQIDLYRLWVILYCRLTGRPLHISRLNFGMYLSWVFMVDWNIC